MVEYLNNHTSWPPICNEAHSECRVPKCEMHVSKQGIYALLWTYKKLMERTGGAMLCRLFLAYMLTGKWKQYLFAVYRYVILILCIFATQSDLRLSEIITGIIYIDTDKYEADV